MESIWLDQSNQFPELIKFQSPKVDNKNIFKIFEF